MKNFISSILISLAMVSSALASDLKIYTSQSVGSAPDIISRKIADEYQKRTGQKMSVIPVTGGNHILSINAWKKDPNSAIMLMSSQTVYNPVLFSDLPYTMSDFEILGQIGLGAAVFVVRADSPLKSVRSFEKDIKSLSTVNIAVGAVDSMANANSVINAMKLSDAKIVNFRTINDALVSTLGGHTTMAVLPGNFPTIWQMVKTGELRVIGSSGPYEIIIDGHKVPSLTESLRVPGFMGGTWLAVHPKNTTNDQMTTTLKQIINDPEFHKEIAHLILIRDNSISMQSLIDQAKKYQHYIKNN